VGQSAAAGAQDKAALPFDCLRYNSLFDRSNECDLKRQVNLTKKKIF